MVSVGLSIQIRGPRIDNSTNDLPIRKSAIDKYMSPVIPDRIEFWINLEQSRGEKERFLGPIPFFLLYCIWD